MSQAITNPHGVNITMSEFTDNVTTDSDDHTVSGDGIFDILMVTATKHLTAQLAAGRIRGEDYTVLYMQVYQATLSAALQIWLQKPLAELQKESEAAKKSLYLRQIEGFDEDFQQKMIKIGIDGYSVLFSVAKDSFLASGVPAILQKTTLDDLFNKYVMKDMDSYKYGRDYLKEEGLIPNISSNY